MTRLEQAVEEILDLKRQNAELKRALLEAPIMAEMMRRLPGPLRLHSDAIVERDFWKSAAERALRLWDRAQDDLEDTKSLARRAARLARYYISCYPDCDESRDDRALAEKWLEQLADVE